MTMTTDQVADLVVETVQQHSMNTPRSQQQAEHRIGSSEIGSCREYLRLMIAQHPYDEGADDDKWAAFVGTALGARLEEVYEQTWPDVLSEHAFVTTFPETGWEIPGHTDTVDVPRDIVIDWKAKDGLTMVGPGKEIDRAHRYQVASYVLGLRQAGVLTEDSQGFLVYVDRSGNDQRPVVIEVVVDDELIAEIEEWIGDAVYAHLNNQEAPKDRHYNWCEIACPFFLSCRALDLPAEDVIDDPEVIEAAKVYRAGLDMEKEGAKMKRDAKPLLEGRAGLLQDAGLKLYWTHVNESTSTVTRRAHNRINVREVK